MKKKMLVSAVAGFSILSVIMLAHTENVHPSGGDIPRAISAMPTTDTSKRPKSVQWGICDVIESKNEDEYLLAKIAMAEAEDEDIEGKALVMLVVLNRVKSEGFPGNIRDVIYEKRQFSPIENGRFDRVEPNKDCWKALDMVRNNKWDGSQGALYFESKSDSAWHSENLDFLFRHGKHYFYREKER